jgi:hypothetical protein
MASGLVNVAGFRGATVPRWPTVVFFDPVFFVGTVSAPERIGERAGERVGFFNLTVCVVLAPMDVIAALLFVFGSTSEK